MLAILGGLTSVGSAEPKLTVSFDTGAFGGEYTPKNVVAVWIEGPLPAGQTTGPFVKTIGRWAGQRAEHLVGWRNKAGIADTDAISGATRLDHLTRLTVEWDVKDKLGVLVPDGDYAVRMELADQSSSTTGENGQGTFVFTKSLLRDNEPGLDTVTFKNVSVDYDPTFGECNNNVVDPGETCDPPGSCPTACDDSGDACMPNVVQGLAADCTAACTIVPVTACISDDGCCADGCTPAQDDDCINNETVDGGCAAGTGSSPGALIAFGLVGGIALVATRRRRRA